MNFTPQRPSAQARIAIEQQQAAIKRRITNTLMIVVGVPLLYFVIVGLLV